MYSSGADGAPQRGAMHRESGYTIVEVIMSSVIGGVMLISLYAGFTFGFQQIRLTRQEERAAQILQEKMELMRLLTWPQVATGYVPATFQESFYSSTPTNAVATGSIVYSGGVLITNAPITESYSNDLRKIQVYVSWVYDGRTHYRTNSTFVSQYGMQNYIY